MKSVDEITDVRSFEIALGADILPMVSFETNFSTITFPWVTLRKSEFRRRGKSQKDHVIQLRFDEEFILIKGYNLKALFSAVQAHRLIVIRVGPSYELNHPQIHSIQITEEDHFPLT